MGVGLKLDKMQWFIIASIVGNAIAIAGGVWLFVWAVKTLTG